MKGKKDTSVYNDDEPYHHPVLEEQLVIRFPADIAARLSSEIDEANFRDFELTFIDERKAIIKIFGEELIGVLYNLPTIVETYRTVDGSHLYKSADIGNIIIVSRQGSEEQSGRRESYDDLVNEKDRNSFLYKDGLTPPTRGIVLKRQIKRDSSLNQERDSSIQGIEYWEIVEIQIQALMAKDRRAKPIVRHEFFEEPDVDPITLEKVLRKKVSEEFKGYSGNEIDDIELQDSLPLINIPKEIVGEEITEEEEIDDENVKGIDLEEESQEEEESSSPTNINTTTSPETPKTLTQEEQNEKEDEDVDEYEEEDDNEDRKRADLESKRDQIINNIKILQVKLEKETNQNVISKLQDTIKKLKETVQSINKELSG